MTTYEEFLVAKEQAARPGGIQVDESALNSMLFGFQKSATAWALGQGRAALFFDCGLGKTPMQLEWARVVFETERRPVLILTPLAVSAQTMREGEKFGIECCRSHDGSIPCDIVVTNYEQLHKFDATKFAGVVCDESSILKSFDGTRRGEITEFMRRVPYRLLATATAAPNDYIELGTSSEALGYLGHIDMLNRFFTNKDNVTKTSQRYHGEAVKWRFKGHAQVPFWRWVVSWAKACRRPSDIGGFDDGDFVLPDLIEKQHLVEILEPPEGMLFNLPAINLREQREERKRTIRERCEKAAALVADTGQPALVWCHMNAEGDLLEKMIPDAIQVSGSDPNEVKEERLLAFANGEARVLVTKPKIGAWGLNFQHCAHIVYFPSHSYEQYYQSVRRCWRFGQKRPVVVDIILTEGERRVMSNLKRKAEAAATMFDNLVAEMNQAIGIRKAKRFETKERIPSWL